MLVSAVGAPAVARQDVVPVRDRVQLSDLPSVRQVASQYPNLRGGSQDPLRSRRLDLLDGDCLSYSSSVYAASGRWTSYDPAPGKPGYFEGKTSPVVFVYKFHTLAQSQSALAKVRASIERCAGHHGTPEDYVNNITPIKIPRLGQGRLGFRAKSGSVNSVSNQYDPQYFVNLWARKGRYVVYMFAQKDDAWPALDPAVAVTRFALRRVG